MAGRLAGLRQISGCERHGPVQRRTGVVDVLQCMNKNEAVEALCGDRVCTGQVSDNGCMTIGRINVQDIASFYAGAEPFGITAILNLQYPATNTVAVLT